MLPPSAPGTDARARRRAGGASEEEECKRILENRRGGDGFAAKHFAWLRLRTSQLPVSATPVPWSKTPEALRFEAPHTPRRPPRRFRGSATTPFFESRRIRASDAKKSQKRTFTKKSALPLSPRALREYPFRAPSARSRSAECDPVSGHRPRHPGDETSICFASKGAPPCLQEVVASVSWYTTPTGRHAES